MIEAPITCAYADDGSVRVFRTLGDAEGAVEGVDICPDDIAYDRNGLALQFKAVGVDMARGLTGATRLEPAEEKPTHRAELVAHLRRYFTYLSTLPHVDIDQAWAATAPLEQLLAKGLELEDQNARGSEGFAAWALGVILLLVLTSIIWLRC